MSLRPQGEMPATFAVVGVVTNNLRRAYRIRETTNTMVHVGDNTNMGGDVVCETQTTANSLPKMLLRPQGENLNAMHTDYACRLGFLPAVEMTTTFFASSPMFVSHKHRSFISYAVVSVVNNNLRRAYRIRETTNTMVHVGDNTNMGSKHTGYACRLSFLPAVEMTTTFFASSPMFVSHKHRSFISYAVVGVVNNNLRRAYRLRETTNTMVHVGDNTNMGGNMSFRPQGENLNAVHPGYACRLNFLPEVEMTTTFFASSPLFVSHKQRSCPTPAHKKKALPFSRQPLWLKKILEKFTME